MLCSGSGVWARNAAARLSNFGPRWNLKRGTGTAATVPSVNMPQKIEIFVDDKKVLVDPGMTILQVFFKTTKFKYFYCLIFM